MRTRTQRLEDRLNLEGAIERHLVVEVCRTIDDMAERIEDKLDELGKLTNAVDALVDTIRRGRT